MTTRLERSLALIKRLSLKFGEGLEAELYVPPSGTPVATVNVAPPMQRYRETAGATVVEDGVADIIIPADIVRDDNAETYVPLPGHLVKIRNETFSIGNPIRELPSGSGIAGYRVSLHG